MVTFPTRKKRCIKYKISKSLDNLFNSELNLTEEDIISRLEAIKTLILWIINRETLIRNPNLNESKNKCLK